MSASCSLPGGALSSSAIKAQVKVGLVDCVWEDLHSKKVMRTD